MYYLLRIQLSRNISLESGRFLNESEIQESSLQCPHQRYSKLGLKWGGGGVVDHVSLHCPLSLTHIHFFLPCFLFVSCMHKDHSQHRIRQNHFYGSTYYASIGCYRALHIQIKPIFAKARHMIY